MKFYKRDPAKALAGMAELTLQERGAYNTIIDTLYDRDGYLPDDDEVMRRIMGCHGNEWRAVKKKLLDKHKIWTVDGVWHAKRVDDTLDEAARFSESQRKSAANRWETARKHAGKRPETADKSLPYSEKDQQKQQSPDAREFMPYTPTPTIQNSGRHDARARTDIPFYECEDESLLDRVIAAAGIDISKERNPARWLGSEPRYEVDRWVALGLTDAEIVETIAEVMSGRGQGPPKTLAYFREPMQRRAGLKGLPALTPIAGGKPDGKSARERRAEAELESDLDFARDLDRKRK